MKSDKKRFPKFIQNSVNIKKKKRKLVDFIDSELDLDSDDSDDFE